MYSMNHYVRRGTGTYLIPTILYSLFGFGTTNLHEKNALLRYCKTGIRIQQRQVSGVHSITVEKLAQPTPFHYIYHHVQSCGVRSSREGRYTPPISTLSLNVPVPCAIQGAMSYSYKLLTVSEGLLVREGGGGAENIQKCLVYLPPPQ
jgi:hypothetical protein